MALFGGSEKRKERSDAVEAELGRLAALPLSELALETMTKGFAGSDGYLSVTEVSGALMAAADCGGLSQEQQLRLNGLVFESAQILEHACLIRWVFHGSGGDHAVYHYDVMATRLGFKALAEDGTAAILAGS
jgi:hypothetical protein